MLIVCHVGTCACRPDGLPMNISKQSNITATFFVNASYAIWWSGHTIVCFNIIYVYIALTHFKKIRDTVDTETVHLYARSWYYSCFCNASSNLKAYFPCNFNTFLLNPVVQCVGLFVTCNHFDIKAHICCIHLCKLLPMCRTCVWGVVLFSGFETPFCSTWPRCRIGNQSSLNVSYSTRCLEYARYLLVSSLLMSCLEIAARKLSLCLWLSSCSWYLPMWLLTAGIRWDETSCHDQNAWNTQLLHTIPCFQSFPVHQDGHHWFCTWSS